jgi:hypothetical protein
MNFMLHSYVYGDKQRKEKDKAIPIKGRGGLWGFETSRLPHFLDNWLTDDSEVVNLTRRPRPLLPGRSLALISFIR